MRIPQRDRWNTLYAVNETTGCWEWIGYVGPRGYARISVGGGRYAMAHRFVYEQLVGPIPEGLTIDHLCRNRRCVNPAHLEPVTRGENTLRGNAPPAIRKRQTHCIRGHELTRPKRTGVGQRLCYECKKITYAVRMADPVRHEHRKRLMREAWHRRQARLQAGLLRSQ